jgi:hypothetical protein
VGVDVDRDRDRDRDLLAGDLDVLLVGDRDLEDLESSRSGRWLERRGKVEATTQDGFHRVSRGSSKVSLGPAIPYDSMPCGQPIPGCLPTGHIGGHKSESDEKNTPSANPLFFQTYATYAVL